MKKLLLTLFTLSSSLLAFSQGTWSPSSIFPDSARYGGISFSIGNYGYVGLGYSFKGANSYWYKDFWQFNPSTSSWVQKANFPGKARFCPASFVIGNYAYVVTGVDSDVHGYSNECWQYNPAHDTWVQKANFPGLPRGYDVGFAIGGKGYVGIGGQAYRYEERDFYCYDTATNTWTRIADFPSISRINSCGFAMNGNGYVCFGADSTDHIFYNDVWEYDTGSNAWTQKANYPGDSIYTASSFIIGNYVYLGTGEGKNNDTLKFLPYFWRYNAIYDSWTQELSYPGLSRSVCYSFAIGDTGYLGLGVDSSGGFFNTFNKFIPDSSTSTSNIKAAQENIVAFPNPFTNTCTLLLPDEILLCHPTFNLYNALGEKECFEILESGNVCILDRGNLQEGIYILSIQFNNKYINKKLIIHN